MRIVTVRMGSKKKTPLVIPVISSFASTYSLMAKRSKKKFKYTYNTRLQAEEEHALPQFDLQQSTPKRKKGRKEGRKKGRKRGRKGGRKEVVAIKCHGYDFYFNCKILRL